MEGLTPVAPLNDSEGATGASSRRCYGQVQAELSATSSVRSRFRP
jgi:hypothetical protein